MRVPAKSQLEVSGFFHGSGASKVARSNCGSPSAPGASRSSARDVSCSAIEDPRRSSLRDASCNSVWDISYSSVPSKDPLATDILPLLPSRIQELIRDWIACHPIEAKSLTEIRLRCGYPICLTYSGGDALLGCGSPAVGAALLGAGSSLASAMLLGTDSVRVDTIRGAGSSSLGAIRGTGSTPEGANRFRGGVFSRETASRKPAVYHGPTDGGLGVVTRDEIEKILSLVSNCSYYALESEFAGGYVTIPGGHRVGIAGEVAVWDDGSLRIREVSAMNFRVARQVKGVGEKVAARLSHESGRLHSTLIISPPGCGKTTLLRDLCRLSAAGYVPAGLRPCQTGVVDERSEIAACYLGVPQHDLGPRVDVLDKCPKAKGIMMLLRSMGPEVIATDEIGNDDDAKAVASALSAGVSILATCHGDSVEGLRRRPYSSWLVSSGYFGRVVVLSGRMGPGTVEHAGAFQ